MSPVALYFASGDSLYAGALLLLTLAAISPFLHRRWLLRLRNIVAWAALALVVVASPPFPWAVDAIFGAAFATWFLSVNRPDFGRSMAGPRVAALALIALLIIHDGNRTG